MYLYEYCRTVLDRKQNMQPEDFFYNKKGHRSVYAFSEQDCIIIKERKHSREFNQFSTYARVLLVDFDDQPEAAEDFRRYLLEEGLSFTRWFSGNRSIHFHVLQVPMYSKNLPFSQYTWMTQVPKMLDEENKPLFDPNIYRSNSLFRLPNTMHKKTGLRKELLEEVDTGKVLEFPLVQNPTKSLKSFGALAASPDLETLLDTLQRYYLKGANSGSKYNALFTLGVSFAELGIQIRTAVDMISLVNNSFSKPKSYEELIRAVTDGYGYHGGKNGEGSEEEEKEEDF